MGEHYSVFIADLELVLAQKTMFYLVQVNVPCLYPLNSLQNRRKCLSETQPAITCLKLTMKNLEQGVKYVQR